jgi:DNA-binding GntR family transcriptional regulator
MLPSLSKLKSLNKPILRDEVYLSIKEGILTGEIPPGERISIGRLLKEIGFSPTPIREALLKLEQEGFVSRLSKGGFIASRFTKKDIDEVFGIRSELERYAVDLAIDLIQKEDIQWLEMNIMKSEGAVRQNRLTEVSRLNTEFHDYLNGVSNNQRLISMINGLRDQIYQYRSAILRVRGMADVSIDDHKKMIKAIKTKDKDLLQRLAQEHILKGKEVILSEIEEGTVPL